MGGRGNWTGAARGEEGTECTLYSEATHGLETEWRIAFEGGGPATTDATPAKKQNMLERNPEQFAYNHGWKHEDFIYLFIGLFVSF